MCRCAERRVALGGVVAAAARGDLDKIAAGGAFVAKSLVADAAALAGKLRLSAAHARLGKGRVGR